MRASDTKHSVIALGAVAVGCLALLSHCGGGSGGGGTPDAGSDGTTPDTGAETDDGGADGEVDAELDATVGGDSSPDAPVDTGGGHEDAGPDATLDAGSDGMLDAAPDATLDAGPDATLDAAPDAMLDAANDAGPSDAAPDVLDAEAGPPEAGKTLCDADAQADAQGCPASMACCGGFCVDTAADPANCGQCGNSCTSTQFCNGLHCNDAIVANVCDNSKATVVFDVFPVDNEAGAAIGAALATQCSTTLNDLAQDAGGVLDPSGRPILGVGNTFVNGGGSYGQAGLKYLEQSGIAPLYPTLAVDGGYYLVDRADGGNVVATTMADLTSSHDFFYVQVAVEPQSGTLVFSGVGLGSSGTGTVAAGYYLSTTIIPNRTNYPKAWYVFEWTDMNGNMTPDAPDTFAPVASGP